MKSQLRRAELRLKNNPPFAWRKAAKRVFYPGCSLPGADPELCLRVYRELQKGDPQLGLWFDCCAKPLRMSGDRKRARREEEALWQRLEKAGVEEVVVACANCYQQFTEQGDGRVRVRFLYELLEAKPLDNPGVERVLHHPCFARQEKGLQEGTLRLADELGIGVKNRHARSHPLPCCLHRNESARKRRAALTDEKLLTYCAHCVVSFQADIPSRHLLQELFGSDRIWRPQGKLALFANYRRFCRLASKQAGN